MRILLSSHRYPPEYGGIETVSRLLAVQFVGAGHEVMVATKTDGGAAGDSGIRIERQPAARRLAALMRWSDICFHNNVCLRLAWPLLFMKRPWVVTTQTWVHEPRGPVSWNARLKRYALRHATNVYISTAVAKHVGTPGTIIPNPYEAEVFRRNDNVQRDRILVYVGRLVSDKGVDILLRALACLKMQGLKPDLTLIGGGSEEASLRALTGELDLTGQVQFAGPRFGRELAELLNHHRIMVVPSRWAEPFGVAALEGIACGCAVVGSADGGLPEAIGPCGLTFPNGSAEALAEVLAELLSSDGRRISALLGAAPTHLAKHAPDVIARRYLEVFAQAMGSSAT